MGFFLKGRLVMAAKQYQSIAELYECDVVDIPNSLIYYEKAADLFKTEENNSYNFNYNFINKLCIY